MPPASHWERQENFYASAEAKRYRWLTQNPVVVQAEDRLLGWLGPLVEGKRMLEIGCGEGANWAALHRLGVSTQYVGFDYFLDKIRFCKKQHSGSSRFLVADGQRPFPFQDGSFDVVLLRDVLHHVELPARENIVRESFRVLKTGGSLAVVEGNALNLINRVYSLLWPHERLMRETVAPRLSSWLKTISAPCAGRIENWMEEPSNLFRFLLHYQIGLPFLGKMAGAAGVLLGCRPNGKGPAGGSRNPRWAYSMFRIVKLKPAGLP